MIDVIKYCNKKLILLDQTKLPNKIVYNEQKDIKEVWNSIKELKVRGAPLIGVAAAFGLVNSMLGLDLPKKQFLKKLKKNGEYLISSRPTAVNLSWAINRIIKTAENSSSDFFNKILLEAKKIHYEDIILCNKIGESGKHLIKDGFGVLTHCNAGALATSGIGTALAPLYLAHSDGVKFKLFADETRPLLQGARLTTWEAKEMGLDVTLICDNMAAYLMSKGKVDIVIVGCDRVAANGDIANKIGTLSLAILANYFKIHFYVAAPFSTIDFETKCGAEIRIEQRDSSEITSIRKVDIAPKGIKTENPAFDVTPANLITGYITEKGITKSINPKITKNFVQ